MSIRRALCFTLGLIVVSAGVSRAQAPIGPLPDFDGDGKGDLLLRNRVTGQNTGWLMNGTTVLASAALPTIADPNWEVKGIGDFDGNGKADVIWRNKATGDNLAWLMNGLTVATSALLPTIADINWEIQGVGDFDGNGKADVIWRNKVNGQNLAWLMNGVAVATSGPLSTISDLNWEIKGIGDFDADGKADVIWRNKLTGQNLAWLMNGVTVTLSGFLPTIADLNWEIKSVGDVDGNGKADVIWRNKVNGQNIGWLMNGLTVASSAFLSTIADLNWEIQGIGDYSGDGKADLVWRNKVTGQNIVWLMNGLTVATSAFLPTIADTNWDFAGGVVIRPGIPTIQYMYDALGRLIAVAAPGGDTAVYHYDAVGNVLSIDRHASTQVSIVSFSPGKGPVGTQVTIFGTGFSAIIAQDTVTFNGTAATISSATTTQLVVTVPAGATTGTIGVTAPGGSATSAAAFTVASVAAPTITSFTPSIGIAGTAVSVSGTNFDTTPANDRVKVNNTLVAVASVTTTTLGTTIPTLTASGPITIATPLGTAVSATDLFVPPSGYATTAVDYTGRLAMGGASQTVTISTAGKIGLVTFAGTAGQRFSLIASGSTFGGTGGCNLHFSVVKPDTSVLLPEVCMPNGLIDGPTLPVTATYTILLQTFATGSVTLSITSFVDVAGPITPNGSSVPITIASPGQNAKLTFSGTAGQTVSALATNLSWGGCFSFWLGILKPDGSPLTNAPFCGSSGSVTNQTLPTTGTYTVFFDPVGASTGNATLTVTSP